METFFKWFDCVWKSEASTESKRTLTFKNITLLRNETMYTKYREFIRELEAKFLRIAFTKSLPKDLDKFTK